MSVIRSVEGHGTASNCYLFLDDAGENAAIIDPSVQIDEALPVFGPILPIVRAILLTHAHADHLIALREWKEATGAPVLIGESDLYALNDPIANVADLLGFESDDFGQADRGLVNGEKIGIGDETLTILHTPGHTVGSV